MSVHCCGKDMLPVKVSLDHGLLDLRAQRKILIPAECRERPSDCSSSLHEALTTPPRKLLMAEHWISCVSADGCPVVLDPRNNMPIEPNQRPTAGQKKFISTQRLSSTIPKGGTDTTWVYPSPQMFYNGVLSLSSCLYLFSCTAWEQFPIFLKIAMNCNWVGMSAIPPGSRTLQFAAALHRKNKAEDVTEDDMEAVIF